MLLPAKSSLPPEWRPGSSRLRYLMEKPIYQQPAPAPACHHGRQREGGRNIARRSMAQWSTGLSAETALRRMSHFTRNCHNTGLIPIVTPLSIPPFIFVIQVRSVPNFVPVTTEPHVAPEHEKHEAAKAGHGRHATQLHNARHASGTCLLVCGS